jgi:DNA invertase Pin-like site-specific DNA recombinase
MFTEFHRKVRTEHLRRDAYLYVRQSTSRQVLENSESTKRQYALRDQAVALGWPIERVHTVDDDQGRSGARAENRDGFQKLVSEVALGHAGLLLGLEVSRLARNNADWQRLLELCALSGCLVGDEDGIYDPVHFNDRLLLGLKGTMSEAELHVLRARLLGGQLNKARRGALEVPLPIGLVYNAAGAVILDPDPRIQASLRLIFDTFRQSRTAAAVEARFRQEDAGFPRRIHRGISKGRVIFGPLAQCRIVQILHNPRYAGAFVYGRHSAVASDSQSGNPGAQKRWVTLPRTDWTVLIQDAHPGYISWDEFERNEATLRHNLPKWHARMAEAPQSSALLQGRVLCGQCGTRMQVVDLPRSGDHIHYYTCGRAPASPRQKRCRWIHAQTIDAAIEALLIQTVTSTTVEITIAVHDRVIQQREHAEGPRRKELERSRREADLKRRRFLTADPDHRLVADALEADWNEALRRLDALQQQHEHQRHTDLTRLDEDNRAQLLSLAKEFPQAWSNPRTVPAERKRMLGLLIEDVTLMQGDPTAVHVRFRGGRTTSLSVPRPRPPARASKVSPAVIRELDELLKSHPDREAATRLNALGYRNWLGKPFNAKRVANLRLRAGLASRFERLRAQGFLTAREIAGQLGICTESAYKLGREQVLPQQRYGRGHRCLFAPLDGTVFVRGVGGRYKSTRPKLLPSDDSRGVITGRRR